MSTSPSLSSLAASIASWRNGSAGFFQFLDDVQPRVRSSTGGFIPFQPGPREHAEIAKALDGQDISIAVFCWPRRHGKSVTSAMIIVWRFLTRQTEQVAVVANSEKQVVDTAFRTIREAFEQTPFLKRLTAAGSINVLGDRVEFPATGSTIQAFSANPGALWGKKLSCAQISELHAAPRGDEVFAAVAGSLLDTAGSLMLIDSTVSAKSSKLFELYQAATHATDPDTSIAFSHLSYADLDDACRNAPPWISETKLRSLSRQMLPHEFALYHLNRWQDAANTLFPADLLAACTHEYPLDVKALTNGSAYIVGAGLDRAFGGSRHGDRTVTACVLKVVLDDEEHIFVIDADSVFLGRLGGIKSRFEGYHRGFGMSRATLESYGAQDVADWAEATSAPTLNVLTGNVLDVLYTDPERPERVMITHGATRAEDVTYSDWTATTFNRLNFRGTPRRIAGNPNGVNPYGILPFVPLFDRLPDDQFWLPGGNDLIEAQDAVNVALANLWRSVESQAHGQAWATGLSANEVLQFGPDRAIALPQGGQFGFASPNSPITSILSAIEFVLRQTAATHGVGSDVFDLSKVAESGSAKHAGRIDLKEERLDDIAMWRVAEARLFEVLKAVVNTHRPGTIPEGATVALDFAELQDQLTEAEQLENTRAKIELGLWSSADALMALNPDGFPDREAAVRELQRRRDESAALALPL